MSLTARSVFAAASLLVFIFGCAFMEKEESVILGLTLLVPAYHFLNSVRIIAKAAFKE